MPEAYEILERLRKLAAKDNRPAMLPAEARGASALFSFVTRERERIAGVAFPRMAIIVIVEGGKELVTMGRQMRFAAGTVLVMPAGWRGAPFRRSGHGRGWIFRSTRCFRLQSTMRAKVLPRERCRQC